jgi:hypothetical protein
MPLEWQGKKILYPVIVLENLNTPLIMGIDAIHHMSITYLSMSESLLFQEDIIGENKFKLMTVKTTLIPARTSVPVRLGTAIGRRHTPMAAGIQSVTTVRNPDFPALFSQPGLVEPNHQGDITLLLQNCSGVDVEIPRCTAIGFLENLQNDTFKQIQAIDHNQLEKEMAKDKPAPAPMSKEDKGKFLDKIRINVPAEERDTYIKLLVKHHDVFSQDKNDIGLATNLKHRIDLKDKEPT